MEDNWVKKIRGLTFALIGSGALNIGLITTLVVSSSNQDSSQPSTISHKASEIEQKSSVVSALEEMSKQSFRELVALLTNREVVDENYAKRDLAVSALTSFCHFNLEKALAAPVAERRSLQLDGGQVVELFPGLSEEQFNAIIRFAYQEKWPLTSKGLFSLLQKLPEPRDETLTQAFVVTPEFYALQVLFQKSNAPEEPATLLQMVSEGNWDLIDSFAKSQSQAFDASVEKRRHVLLSYLAHRSPTAARLLLKTDGAFARQKLDDAALLDLLSLFVQKSDEAERFCIALLQSPRSGGVWQAAAEKLYAFNQEPIPVPFDLKAAMGRFAPKSARPAVAAAKPAAKTTSTAAGRTHVVKDGESLWKIARQYKVKVEELARLNDPDATRLRPGMTLRIPD